MCDICKENKRTFQCCVCGKNKCESCYKLLYDETSINEFPKSCGNCKKYFCVSCGYIFTVNEEKKCDNCDYTVYKCSYNLCECGERIYSGTPFLNNCKVFLKVNNEVKKKDNFEKVVTDINYKICEICGKETIHNKIVPIYNCCHFSSYREKNLCCRMECYDKVIHMYRSKKCKACLIKVCDDHIDKLKDYKGEYFCDICYNGAIKRNLKPKPFKGVRNNYDGIMENHLLLIRIDLSDKEENDMESLLSQSSGEEEINIEFI